MRIQERLNLITDLGKKIKSDEEGFVINEDPDVFNIFERDSYAEKIITSLISQNKNIMVVSDVYTEKEFPVQYIRKFIEKTETVEILYDSNQEFTFVSASKILIPETNIVSFVKILEYIIYGYKSFVFGFSVNSNENFIQKIKLLIALNYKNLTEENIKTLISSSNLAVVFVAKNEDGLFYVKEISEIVSLDNELKMESSYEFINVGYSSEISSLQNEQGVCSSKHEVEEISKVENVVIENKEDVADVVVVDSSQNTQNEENIIDSIEHVEYSVGPIKNILADDENNIYKDGTTEEKEEIIEENNLVVEEHTIEQENTVVDNHIIEDDLNDEQEVQIVEIAEEKVKANKYKLLKDKIKMKKFNL